MEVDAGPLIAEPVHWTLVFERRIVSWWGHLAIGRHKHVRAFAYVPFLHVWVFYDVGLTGAHVILAADGQPADRVIAAWIETADLINMPARRDGLKRPPILGFCVPAIKRLLGIRCGALRPSALYKHCLAHGGITIERDNGRSTVPSAAG